MKMRTEQNFVILLLLCVVTVMSRECRYGNGCVFPCRCANGGSCDQKTGDCLYGCDPGILGQEWRGLGCQVGNIALGKFTTQSGTRNDMTSDRAIDGNLATNASEQNCARVHNQDGGVAEWSVDLEHASKVESLLIYSTFNPDMASTITNFSFIVRNDTGSEHVCYHYSGRAPVGYMATLSINCIPAVIGRYVVLRRFGKQNPEWMTLCEVSITGYRHIDCSLCPNSCNDVQGCSECPPGRRLPDCSRPCERGFYGDKCEYRCGACRRGWAECNPVNGDCPSGCQGGYTGNRCDMHEGSARDEPSRQGTVTGYPAYSRSTSLATGPIHPKYKTHPDDTMMGNMSSYKSEQTHPGKGTTTISASRGGLQTNTAAETKYLSWTIIMTSLLFWHLHYNYIYHG